jgi:hypothetical protein
MLRRVVGALKRRYTGSQLPAVCREARARDRGGLRQQDPDLDRCLQEAVAWICRAQDHSLSADGGVAHNYSLQKGWSTSYPETTGYIIPTLLAYSEARDDKTLLPRVQRMLDWLVSIQFPEGAFQGGRIGRTPVVPVTFVTGQILLGLAAGVRCFGKSYHEPMVRTARWLRDNLDADGCWRKGRSPFCLSGEVTYETHVAWGLFEAERLAPKEGFAEAGLRNVQWALSYQRENGWFENCCLDNPAQPLTHTLGYALRGVIEAYRFQQDEKWLAAALKTADGLLRPLRPDGFLPGCIRSDWTGATKWACLTGTSQVAACWFLLHSITADSRYREAGLAANRYVRRTVDLDGTAEIRGAVQGAFPVDGGFHPYEYPNWATKFYLDALLMERDLLAR